MAVEIPLINKANFNFQYTLDGSEYLFTFVWNEASSAYYLDIEGISDESISIKGLIRLVTGVDLVEKYGIASLKPLYVFDLTGQRREPTIDLFGDEFRMYYEGE